MAFSPKRAKVRPERRLGFPLGQRRRPGREPSLGERSAASKRLPYKLVIYTIKRKE
jgi:hypothetical protein